MSFSRRTVSLVAALVLAFSAMSTFVAATESTADIGVHAGSGDGAGWDRVLAEGAGWDAPAPTGGGDGAGWDAPAPAGMA